MLCGVGFLTSRGLQHSLTLYVSNYIYIYIYIYTHIHIYICLSIHTYIYMSIYMSFSVSGGGFSRASIPQRLPSTSRDAGSQTSWQPGNLQFSFPDILASRGNSTHKRAKISEKSFKTGTNPQTKPNLQTGTNPQAGAMVWLLK